MKYALEWQGCGLTIPEQSNNVVYTEEGGMYILCVGLGYILVIWFLMVKDIKHVMEFWVDTLVFSVWHVLPSGTSTCTF